MGYSADDLIMQSCLRICSAAAAADGAWDDPEDGAALDATHQTRFAVVSL